MKSLQFLMFLLTATFCSYAQKKVVFIIDTLEGYGNISNGDQTAVFYSEVDQTMKIIEAINFSHHPHVVAQIANPENLFIKLDDLGGHLRWAMQENQLPDTVKINKWMIYKNGHTDTIAYSEGYWRRYNDSAVYDPTLEKNSFKTIKHTGIQELSRIDVVINQYQYAIPIKTIIISEVQTGHGYKPHKKYLRYLSQKHSGKPIKKTYRFKKFHYSSWHTKQIFEGTIDSLHQ